MNNPVIDLKIKGDKSIKETLTSLARIAVGGVAAVGLLINPGLGAGLAVGATGLNELLPSYQRKNFNEFINQLDKRLKAIFKDLEEELFKKLNEDEFQYMFNKCFKAAMEEIDINKRVAYINIVTSTAIYVEEFDKIAFYRTILDNLSALDVQLLAFLSNPEEFIKMKDIEYHDVSGSPINTMGIVFPNLSKNELEISWKNLFIKGLLKDDLPRGLTTQQGIALIKGRVSDAGKELIKYISDPQGFEEVL